MIKFSAISSATFFESNYVLNFYKEGSRSYWSSYFLPKNVLKLLVKFFIVALSSISLSLSLSEIKPAILLFSLLPINSSLKVCSYFSEISPLFLLSSKDLSYWAISSSVNFTPYLPTAFSFQVSFYFFSFLLNFDLSKVFYYFTCYLFSS